MTEAAKKIQQAIEALPLDDLLALHELLVVSIHQKEEDDQLDPQFRKEIRRRLDEINSGKVQGIDAFEALKGM